MNESFFGPCVAGFAELHQMHRVGLHQRKYFCATWLAISSEPDRPLGRGRPLEYAGFASAAKTSLLKEITC